MLKEGERIMVREDAFQDAPRMKRHYGKTGKVVQCWPMATRPFSLMLLDDGTSLYAYADEVAPLQVTVGGKVLQSQA